MNEVGEVIWHSLDKHGNTKYYDVLWEAGNIELNILISELDAINVKEHEHTAESEKTHLSERSYKRRLLGRG